MIIVYHKREPRFNDTEPLFEELERVCSVGVNDLDKAYELTQNLDGPWINNWQVTEMLEPRRSTSVGDVLEKDGKFYLVSMLGFRELFYPEVLAQRGGHDPRYDGLLKFLDQMGPALDLEGIAAAAKVSYGSLVRWVNVEGLPLPFVDAARSADAPTLTLEEQGRVLEAVVKLLRIGATLINSTL